MIITLDCRSKGQCLSPISVIFICKIVGILKFSSTTLVVSLKKSEILNLRNFFSNILIFLNILSSTFSRQNIEVKFFFEKFSQSFKVRF